MSATRDALVLGATKVQTDATVAKTSHWHIPGGTVYDQARVVVLYWDDMAAAERWANRLDKSPEMAHLTIIEEHRHVSTAETD